MIALGDTNNTSTSYGIYASSCGFMKIYNNSINVLNNGTSSRAIYMPSGGGNEIINNNIAAWNG